jgi:hypothetical protein
MTNTPQLLAEPAVPEAARSLPGDPGGFQDCRGHWHSWAEEEDE